MRWMRAEHATLSWCDTYTPSPQNVTSNACQPANAVVSRQVIAQQNATVTSFYSTVNSSAELNAVQVRVCQHAAGQHVLP